MPVSSVIAGSALVAKSSSNSGSAWGTLIPLLLILAVGYFLFLRPARNRQRQAMQTRANVTPGVEVTTTAGLIAMVVSVDDDTVTLEVAPGVHSRYVKGAIARVNTPVEQTPVDEPTVDPVDEPTVDTTEQETPDESPPGVTRS